MIFFALLIFLTNLHFNRRCKLAETKTQIEKQDKKPKTVIERQHWKCGAAFRSEVIGLLIGGLTNRYLFRFL